MSRFRQDPGDCPICGAPHCSCGGGPVEVVQLPMRDAVAVTASAGQSAEPAPAHAVAAATPADMEPLGDGSDDRPFSTATYRGRKRKRS